MEEMVLKLTNETKEILTFSDLEQIRAFTEFIIWKKRTNTGKTKEKITVSIRI